MDEQRALLDRLMGFNRDGDRPDDAAIDFEHAKVCKPWLCGLCPRELFQNTRLDVGACELLHIPHLRAAYEQSSRSFGYERDLANELSRLLDDVEKKIARGQKRLHEDTQDAQDADSLKRRDVQDVNQKLRVCDVCGAFLSIFDSDRRLADHFGGKVHMGYVQIRQKLTELHKRKEEKKEMKEKKEEPSRRERSVGRSRERSRDRERSRSRRRSSRHRTRRSSSSSRSRSRDRKRSRRRLH
ncbi:hypothetical protein KRP22_011187 [Phytophthora ramorum]|uniref:putative RNA-binding protein Luc7-like 2 n=1 Tax=Phytophthora ramorum TaxID=164328 RepID=UPI0030B30C8F|nr:putative RNA-binding protein Luc7-like 2 [Phytophthora ramorum]KAH7504446.1 putative RNA-binding protein Luc7-like 2 [Phytophthora ramorum]